MFSPQKLARLLKNHLPFSLNCLPSTACLVGGAVRDALLDRQQNYLDLDFVLPEFAVETARKIAEIYKAGFVVLDEERRIARLVFEQGTVDFAQQEGNCIETDLRRRDFTINAIAYNPHSETLVDPLGGALDIEKKILRMVSQANLEDDPLRLLRAYRQTAQLNFTIEPVTRATLRKLAPLLAKIAAERVQNELGYLLAHPGGNIWLIAAWKDGLLAHWLKNITMEKLQLLDKVEQAAEILPGFVERPVAFTPEIIFRAKLACLVADDSEIAESELVNLKYPRADIRTIATALKYLPQLQQSAASLSLREQYFLFLGVGEIWMTLALLAVAASVDREAIAKLTSRYLNPCDRVAHPKPLVRGNEIIKQLKLSPGPAIGRLLIELQVAYIEDKISTPDEAIQLARILTESYLIQ
jgi:tRNA nucleotidyltransferase (CCA-adding enzyme)